MREAEPPGMQGLARKGDDALADRTGAGDRAPGTRAIDRIADQRMAEGGEMHADLMGSPCRKPALQERGMRLERALDPVAGDRRFSPSLPHDRHFFTVPRTAADIAGDFAGRR